MNTKLINFRNNIEVIFHSILKKLCNYYKKNI